MVGCLVIRRGGMDFGLKGGGAQDEYIGRDGDSNMSIGFSLVDRLHKSFKGRGLAGVGVRCLYI